MYVKLAPISIDIDINLKEGSIKKETDERESDETYCDENINIRMKATIWWQMKLMIKVLYQGA